MKVKELLMIILLHCLFFFIGASLFVLSFHTGLFKNVDVLFNRGIALLVVCCVFMLLVMILYKRSSCGGLFTYRDIILSITLIATINLVIFTHLPVTADRSISVFLLGYMDKHSDTTLSDGEITKVFTKKYLYEYGAMDKRFHEQIVLGNIAGDKNGYTISNRGKLIIKLYVFIADIFGISKKLISSDL